MGKEIIYPLRIDGELWEKFKETFPRNKTPTEVLKEFVEAKVKENERKGGE